MKLQKRPSDLRSLRREIAALCVVKCRMTHEQVIRARESMLPVVSRVPEGRYQRIGLCSPEVRAKRLGCSHTSARIKLQQAIDELKTSDRENGPGPLLSSELVWLNNQIHLLDHRKGEAEATLARVLEEAYRLDGWKRKGKDLIKAENAVHQLEETHDKYVERLSILRDRVVIEMDKLMANQFPEGQLTPE